MKPYQLVAALMHKERLRTLTLAKKVKKPELQPQIHRFVRGDVPSPENSTAAPIAKFFSIPLEAIYDEKVATQVAKDLGLTVVDWPPKSARKATAAADSEPSTVQAALRQLQKLSPAERRQFFALATRSVGDQGPIKGDPSNDKQATTREKKRGGH